MEYRCDITNKFVLPVDDENDVEDPRDILSRIEQSQKVKSKKDKENSKPVTKKNEKLVKHVPAQPETNNRPQRSNLNNKPHFNSQPQRGNNNQKSNVEEFDKTLDHPKQGFGETRGQGGIRRAQRHDEKRDQQNGSNTMEHPKQGFGEARGRWTPRRFDEKKNNSEQQNGNHEVAVHSSNANNNSVPSDKTDADKLEQTASKPEEPLQMSLDDFKAQKEQTRLKAAFNIRKAGEGCNDPKWKQMYILKKKQDDEEEEYEEDSDETEENTKTKNTLGIKFQFYDEQSRRAARRARGGPTNNNEQKDFENNQNARPKREKPVPVPNVADESDFPNLS